MPILAIPNWCHKLSFPILYTESRQSVSDDLLTRSSLEIALGYGIRQMHERMAFIGQDPTVLFPFEDHREVVTIVEHEGCENAIPVDTFGAKRHALANLLSEIPLDITDDHA